MGRIRTRLYKPVRRRKSYYNAKYIAYRHDYNLVFDQVIDYNIESIRDQAYDFFNGFIAFPGNQSYRSKIGMNPGDIVEFIYSNNTTTAEMCLDYGWRSIALRGSYGIV
jgi:hypothetical protein